jgi:hypothetical protein
MGKTKFEHFDRCDLVEDPDWEVAMEVSVKYIAKILNKMQCERAMQDGHFEVPPEDHFVFGAFDKLYTGEWEWCKHQAIHTQIVKIALSDIHHYLDSWKGKEHVQLVEVDEKLANKLTEDKDFMDVVYEIAEEVAAGDKDLLDYLKSMRRCDDYELIGEELGIPIREVYQRQRKLMRRLEKRKQKPKTK